jgi:transmembrane sensor
MISTEQIRRLLEEFISGKISNADEEELFDLINNQEIDSKIIAWLYMIWDESSKRSIGFHSEGIYEKIRKNFNLPVKSLKEERGYANYVIEKGNKTNRKIVLKLLKYAAVFIVAAVSSYFLLNYSGPGEELLEETYTEIKINKGSKSTIVLPDSTIIRLNSGSYLRYPDHFKGINRQVYFEGEAFFDVKTGQPFPFYVNTGNISIKVTGTEFNVKSFPDDQFIETTLISGRIIIEKRDQEKNLKNQIVLNPNQYAVYNKNTNKLEITDLIIEEEIIPIQAVRVTTEPKIIKSPKINTAWKDDKFVFYDESLDKLAIRLEWWFDVNIEIVDEELKEYRFSGTFKDENIEQALNALKLASSFEFQINQDQVTISKNF